MCLVTFTPAEGSPLEHRGGSDVWSLPEPGLTRIENSEVRLSLHSGSSELSGVQSCFICPAELIRT